MEDIRTSKTRGSAKGLAQNECELLRKLFDEELPEQVLRNIKALQERMNPGEELRKAA
jgi:hypothetical protein